MDINKKFTLPKKCIRKLNDCNPLSLMVAIDNSFICCGLNKKRNVKMDIQDTLFKATSHISNILTNELNSNISKFYLENLDLAKKNQERAKLQMYNNTGKFIFDNDEIFVLSWEWSSNNNIEYETKWISEKTIKDYTSYRKIEILKNNGWNHLGEHSMNNELFYKDYYWLSTKTFDSSSLYSIVKADTKEKALELLIDNDVTFTVSLDKLEGFLNYIEK